MRASHRQPRILIAIASLIIASQARAWIPNGLEIPASELPGVVSIHYTSEKESFFCSGSMISQGTVLTAAHCAQSLKTFLDTIRKAAESAAKSGSVEIAQKILESSVPTIRSGNRTWAISLAAMHPESVREPVFTGKTRINGARCPDGYEVTSSLGSPYCFNARNDVALLFAGSAIKNGGAQAFPSSWLLKLSDETPKMGNPILMAGYGVNDLYVPSLAESVFPYLPPVLTKAIANFFPSSLKPLMSSGSGIKRKGYNTISDVEDAFIFVTGLTQDKGSAFAPQPDGQNATTGSGDSGGPIFLNGKIIGVTSHGGVVTDNSTETNDSAFVRIDRKEIRNFIVEASSSAYSRILNPRPDSPVFKSPQ